MNTKHTPSPWTFINQYGGNYSIVPQSHKSHPENWTIAYIREFQKEDVANARLIAAAPELLEALKEVNEFLKNRAFMGTIRETVSKAIAKAEGRDSLIGEGY